MICDSHKQQPSFKGVAVPPRVPMAHALTCAVTDGGPIRVCTINGIEMIDPSLAEIAQPATLDSVWVDDSEKEFRWLLADPSSTYIKQRDRRLNGRYIEYYLVRFLLMMFRLQRERKTRRPPRIGPQDI